MKYPFSATAGSTLFYALLLWETSTNPTNLYVTKKKNSTLSNLLYTYAPHNRLAVSLLLILWYNKSFCNEGCTLSQVCTQLQKFFASTRKIATTARLANFRIHCDFPLFSLSFAKLARIARNHRVGDFSRYLAFSLFFLSRWRLIRNPVADFNKFMQLKLRKITSQTSFCGTCDICYFFSC